MNYFLLFFRDELASETLPFSKRETQAYEALRILFEDQGASEVKVGVDLHPSTTAVTLQTSDLQTLEFDGPYQASASQLALIVAIDCPDLQSAINLATRAIRETFYVACEIRPLFEFALNSAQQAAGEPSRWP